MNMNSNSKNNSLLKPKQARSARSLRRIVEAVARLLEEKDFREVTIAEIANKAGVAPSLLYTRFRNKDEIEVFFTARFLEGYVEELRLGLANSNTDGLDGLIGTLADVSFRNKAVLRAIAIRQLSGGKPFSGTEEALIQTRLELIESRVAGTYSGTLSAQEKRFIATTLILLIQDFALYARTDSYIAFEDFRKQLQFALSGFGQTPGDQT